jgi:hypothetical protein
MNREGAANQWLDMRNTGFGRGATYPVRVRGCRVVLLYERVVHEHLGQRTFARPTATYYYDPVALYLCAFGCHLSRFLNDLLSTCAGAKRPARRNSSIPKKVVFFVIGVEIRLSAGGGVRNT